jgi:hypothetical protein
MCRCKVCWRHEGSVRHQEMSLCFCNVEGTQCLFQHYAVKMYRGVDAWLQAVLTWAVGGSGKPYASRAQPVNILFPCVSNFMTVCLCLVSSCLDM